MTRHTQDIVQTLEGARAELDSAISNLRALPAQDESAIRYTAHALNNYLAVTGASVELLRRTLVDHPDPQIHLWLDGLEHVTELMGHSVLQLFNASAVAEADLRFEAVDLAAVLQHAGDYAQRLANSKDITVEVRCAPDLLMAWTDRVAVGAILENLISNAIKFSDSGKRVWFTLEGDQKKLSCTVRDEGPGLDAEDMAKLYQRGARLKNSPTAGEPTSGYGLAVAKDLAEQLRGSIECSSTPGVGTSFTLELPTTASV